MTTRQHALPFLTLLITTLILLGTPEIKTTTRIPEDEKLHIIFDMNGVLVDNASPHKILGLKKVILYALLHMNPLTLKKTIKTKLYQFLSLLEPRKADEVNACDEQGNQLPQIMCDWMKGIRSPAELLQAVDQGVASQPDTLETSLVADIARMVFTPEHMVKTQVFVPEALDFVRELKEQGHNVYILSNFPPESFHIMQEENPDIFSLFDGIIISGDVGLIKPDPAIYEYILKTFNLKRDNAFFIDDQPVNIQVAQDCAGITSVLCTPKYGILGNTYGPDISQVRQACNAWQESRAQAVPQAA